MSLILGQRDLPQDFPFSFQPVIEINTTLEAPALIPFTCALRNQSMEIVAGSNLWFSNVYRLRIGRGTFWTRGLSFTLNRALVD